jgi:hypothetical protein
MSQKPRLKLVASQEQSGLHEEALTALIFGSPDQVQDAFDRVDQRAALGVVEPSPQREPSRSR